MCRGTRTCSGPLGSQGGGGRAGLAEERSGDHEAPGTSPSSRPRCTGPAGRGCGPVAQQPSGLRLSTHSHRAGRRRDGRAAGLAGARREGASGPERAGPAPESAADFRALPPILRVTVWSRGRGGGGSPRSALRPSLGVPGLPLEHRGPWDGQSTGLSRAYPRSRRVFRTAPFAPGSVTKLSCCSLKSCFRLRVVAPVEQQH